MSDQPNDAGNGAPPADAGAGSPPAAPPASAFAAADAGSPPPAVGEHSGTPAALPPLAERIPEKYRVAGADGAFDLEASAAKLLDAHGSLEKRLGTGDLPPKSADDYAPTVEGIDFDALKADPKYQSFLKGAHAKGMTNAQVEYILGEYAARAEQSVDTGLSAADFEAQMRAEHWKNPGEYEASMKAGLRAIRAAIPGITAAELASIPNSPTLARVLAKFGAEVAEDVQPSTTAIADADFDTQLATLMAHPAYTDATHAEHAVTLKKVTDLFAKRYQPTT